MSKHKQKYYVVWKGRKPGIYASWEECLQQVKGFSGARFKAFDSIEEANDAFINTAYTQAHSIRGATSSRSALLKTGQVKSSGLTSPILDSISVDAACSKNPGILEYQGVYTRDRRRIFYYGPLVNGTNNVGEFLAIVHALAWLNKMGKNWPVYSDSVTAIRWVLNKKARTTLKRTDENETLFDLIRRAENWLQTHNWNNPILKWETAQWGEIPADFGRKK